MIAQLLPIPCLRGDGWSEMFPRETLWVVCWQADSVSDKCEVMRLFLTLQGGLELFDTVLETQTSLFSAFFTCLTSILMSFSRQKIHHCVLCGGNRWCIDWPIVCVFVLDVMFDGGNLAALHFFTSGRPVHNFNDSAWAEKASRYSILLIFASFRSLSPLCSLFPFILLSL